MRGIRDKIKTLAQERVGAVVRLALGLWPQCPTSRRVLFACNQELQAGYLAEIWNVLKPDPRLDFGLVMSRVEPRSGEAERIRRALPVRERSPFWAHAGRWDLMICADHYLLRGLVTDSRRRIIRISHGFPGKREAGRLYAFGPGAYALDGRIRYTRMFVPSQTVKEWAVRQDPAFADIVTVVGSLGDDKMFAEVERRQEYRSRFGFKPEDTVVFVTGTWGPHSIFRTMGDALLAKTRELQSEFRFVLSTHSIEYRPRTAPERVWGEYLRTQREHGFIVREPWDDWIPYMIASDILLADHTSLALHGALLGLPFVCVPVPEELVEPGTVIREIRDISPMVRADASDLRQALLRARSSYPLDKLRKIAARINSCPGQAAARSRAELYAQLSLSPWPGTAAEGAD
jgi:hypothetical protein